MEQEQIDALKKALHDVPVMISACAAIKISESEKFHSELLSFIQGNFAILSRKPIVFVLERQVPIRVGEKLTVREASKQLAAGACVIRLGLDLSICATTKTKPDMASCCKAGLGTYAAFVEGEALHEIVDGRVIVSRNIANPTAGVGIRGRWSRPASDFAALIADHYEECLRGQKNLRYWHDQDERILLVGPDGTEALFHQNLWWWLNQYTSDALDVYAEPRFHGLNKTDIVIVTEDGKRVVEVKWMGTNGKTSYGKKVINEGLVQIKKYLEDDVRIVVGHLIIYDARSSEEHEADSDFDKKYLHALCEDPKIQFLESETPSKMAKRAVSADKKRLKKKLDK